MTKKIQHSSYIFFTVFMLSACDGNVMFRTKPCEEGMVRQGSACVSETGSDDNATTNTKTVTSSSCKDPDLNKLQKGETFTMCDGSLGEGKLVVSSEIRLCTTDGEQDCVNKSKFKAVDASLLDATKIANGTTILGITGTLRPARQCRNYSDLSRFDSSYPPSNFGWNVTTFLPAAVNIGTDQITFTNPHGLITNSLVRFTTTTTLPSPLVAGTTYYAIYVSTTIIQLANITNGTQIDITTQGTGTHTAHDVADNTPQYFDTIDDYNNNQASSPSSNPWNSNEYLCDASNFINVASASSPLMPSGVIPSNGNRAFTQIWQDQLSGVYVSNILYDATPNNRSWSDLLRMCESLNNASAGNGWRLPTQKELMRLYVNGFSKVAIAGGSLNADFWSSTLFSVSLSMSYIVNLATGSNSGISRNTTWTRALCIR